MARKTATPKSEATPDLLAELVAALKAKGLKPKLEASPSGAYNRVVIDGSTVAYVHAQTRAGIKVTPGLTEVRAGFLPVKPQRGRYGIYAIVNDAAGIKRAVAAIAAAAKAVA